MHQCSLDCLSMYVATIWKFSVLPCFDQTRGDSIAPVGSNSKIYSLEMNCGSLKLGGNDIL